MSWFGNRQFERRIGGFCHLRVQLRKVSSILSSISKVLNKSMKSFGPIQLIVVVLDACKVLDLNIYALNSMI